MFLRIKPSKDGKSLEVWAGAEKVENLQVQKGFNDKGRRSVQAFIFDNPPEQTASKNEKPAGSQSGKNTRREE